MSVRLLEWSGLVEGLGRAEELPVPGGTLDQATRAAVAASGGEVGSTDTGLVVEDGTVLGPDMLAACAAAGRQAGRDARFRVGGRLGQLLAEIALGEDPCVVGWLEGPSQQAPRARLEAADEIEIDPDEQQLALSMPGGEEVRVSDRFAVRVRHPVQLLWANLLALPPTVWRGMVGDGLPAALRLVAAVIGARSTQPDRVAARLTRCAPDARIHPSAVVEASVLESGAVVGPGAVVRGAWLGPGARVEALGICEGSVLGPQAVVQRQALFRYSVLARGAMIGGATQLAVLGPQSALKRGSFGMDQGLGRDVRVAVGQALVRAPLGLSGPTLGSGAQVGSGVWVAPGRRIPAGAVVVGPDPLVDPRTPDGPGAYRVRDGRLERL